MQHVRFSSIEGLKLGKSLFCLFDLLMSNANSQDSLNPKPPTEGIVEIMSRQLAPSVGNLIVVGGASASSPTSSTSPRVSPISFGSFEFTPHPSASVRSSPTLRRRQSWCSAALSTSSTPKEHYVYL